MLLLCLAPEPGCPRGRPGLGDPRGRNESAPSDGARPRPTCGVTALAFLLDQGVGSEGGWARTCSAGRSRDLRPPPPSSGGGQGSAGAAGAREDLPHPFLAAAQPDAEPGGRRGTGR